MLIWQLWATFFRIGLFTFGGGNAMIPFLEKEIVATHRWATMPQMVDIIAVSQMTPGPIAINAATFVGFQVGGVLGSVAATAGLISPSVGLVLALFPFFRRFQEKPMVRGVMAGLRPVVIALIIVAAVQVGQATGVDIFGVVIFAFSLLLLFSGRIHPIFIVLSAALAGIFIYKA